MKLKKAFLIKYNNKERIQLQNFFQPIVPHFVSKHASSLTVTFLFFSQNKLMLTGNLEIKYWKNYLYGLCKLFQSTELLCTGIYVFEVTRKQQYAHWDIITRFLVKTQLANTYLIRCVVCNLLCQRLDLNFLSPSKVKVVLF